MSLPKHIFYLLLTFITDECLWYAKYTVFTPFKHQQKTSTGFAIHYLYSILQELLPSLRCVGTDCSSELFLQFHVCKYSYVKDNVSVYIARRCTIGNEHGQTNCQTLSLYTMHGQFFLRNECY